MSSDREIGTARAIERLTASAQGGQEDGTTRVFTCDVRRLLEEVAAIETQRRKTSNALATLRAVVRDAQSCERHLAELVGEP